MKNGLRYTFVEDGIKVQFSVIKVDITDSSAQRIGSAHYTIGSKFEIEINGRDSQPPYRKAPVPVGGNSFGTAPLLARLSYSFYQQMENWFRSQDALVRDIEKRGMAREIEIYISRDCSNSARLRFDLAPFDLAPG
jgi:hypothetical protein